MLVDIDDLKRALDELLSMVRHPLLALDADLRVKKANEAFLRTFGLRVEAVENQLIYQLHNGKWNTPRLQSLLEAILPENKQVDDFELNIEREGKSQKFRLSARRFFQDSLGMQMILLALEPER